MNNFKINQNDLIAFQQQARKFLCSFDNEVSEEIINIFLNNSIDLFENEDTPDMMFKKLKKLQNLLNNSESNESSC